MVYKLPVIIILIVYMQDYINIGRVENKQNRQMKNKTWVTRHSKIEQKEGKKRGGVKRERGEEKMHYAIQL